MSKNHTKNAYNKKKLIFDYTKKIFKIFFLPEILNNNTWKNREFLVKSKHFFF